MAGDHGLSDIRYKGYSNGQLAQEVDNLRNGPGSESLQNAIEALTKLAVGLVATDVVLRKQLEAIGVSWQGVAADGGTSATEDARIYAEEAVTPVTDSAGGVRDTTASFHTTSNGAPDSNTLNGPTEETLGDNVAGFFGHTTDHAQQVKDTNAARDAAIDTMTGYQNNSSDALNQARTLPVPPGMNLVTTPADAGTGISAVGSSNIGTGFFPGGTPGGSGTAPIPGTGGGGPGGQIPNVGTNPPTPGGPPIPGGGRLPVNPVIPPVGPLPATLRAGNAMMLGEAASAMGSGAASGAGAGAERDRLSRTGNPARGQASAKNAMPLGAAPDEEARAARNAEKFGAKTGRPGSSIMQPAAAGRNAEGEDDKEHIRRYGVDSSDVFEDDRAVAPESIGDDDDDDR